MNHQRRNCILQDPFLYDTSFLSTYWMRLEDDDKSSGNTWNNSNSFSNSLIIRIFIYLRLDTAINNKSNQNILNPFYLLLNLFSLVNIIHFSYLLSKKLSLWHLVTSLYYNLCIIIVKGCVTLKLQWPLPTKGIFLNNRIKTKGSFHDMIKTFHWL